MSNAKSPAMFAHVLGRLGINAAYVPFRVTRKNLGHAIESVRVLDMAGANVAFPYKEDVIPFLDILSEGANIIGSVNTIIRNGDQLKGYNTHSIGIMDALNSVGYTVKGKSALVFGAGGLAKAAVFILNWLGAGDVSVTGKNEAAAEKTAGRFDVSAAALGDIAKGPVSAHIMVNASQRPIPDESGEMSDILDKLDAPRCELALDLNHGPAGEAWRNMAQKKGIRFMDGLSPLAFQARRTFALWTGIQAPPENFLEALSL